MIEQKNENLEMSVEEVKEYLSWAYATLIEQGKAFRRFPSVMLWGAPGVGKSQAVSQIAKIIAKRTGKKVVVTDVRLLLFNPVDLRGIPTSNADKTLAVWLKPKIFQMDETQEVVNILFLDEISAAPPSVQAAAYQITLDRTVGEHALPENCIVIAAGNRVTDKSVAYAMPKALANRLLHIDVKGDFSAWRAWALNAKIHPLVIGFLESNSSLLLPQEGKELGNAFPTPRSWEMVSNILTDISENVKKVFPLVKGCIGWETAYQFLMWAEIYETIPTPKEICNDKNVGVPVRAEALQATVTALASYLTERHSNRDIDNAVGFVRRIQKEEFRISFLRMLMSVQNEKLQNALSENDSFTVLAEYYNII